MPASFAQQGSGQSATESPEIRSPHGVVIAKSPRPGRFLRGDYEPTDMLMLVHDDTWSDSLEAIIEHVGESTPVEVLLQDARQGLRYAHVSEGRCVGLTEVAYDTPWIRDYGPLQVSQGRRTVWIDFAYAEDRAEDDGIPELLGKRFGRPVAYEAAQLDGGALVSNGRGVCAVSDVSVLESGLATEDVTELAELARRIGCPALAVVPALPEEQTGHVDVSIQFLAANTVAVAAMDPARFPLHAELLDRTAELISYAAERIGQHLEVVRVPMHARGEVFYSYLNGTRVGDVFLVPSYGRGEPDYEQAAYEVLAAHMPGVRLAPIPADNMVELGGAIHCITLGLSLPPWRRPACTTPRLARRPASRGVSDVPRRGGKRRQGG